ASRIPTTVVRAGLSDYAGGCEAARRLMKRKAQPEGVFCVNDLMAFGLIDHLRQTGLRVPEDVSVVGFDDLPMAAWAPYSLTTIRQDPERIAREVVRILDARASRPDGPPMLITFPVELVVRRTVRGLK